MRPQTTACLAGAALLLTACTTTTPSTDGLTQRLVMHWGARVVDNDRTSNNEDSGAVIGLDYSSRCWDWLGWEAGLTYSEHEEFLLFSAIDETIEVLEASAGARATYMGFADAGAGLLPYASAGLSYLAMDGGDADSSAAGAYLRGGLCYVFGCGLTLGADLKGLVSSSDYLESYLQFTLQFGWSF